MRPKITYAQLCSLEIYNPTAASVDLTGYSIISYTNGNTTPTNTLILSGTIAAGDVYVVANPSAGAAINGEKDTASNVTNYNGNDAVGLYMGTTLIDVIGEIGVDPGVDGWVVGTGATLNSTLVRKASVNEGSTDWTVGVNQWDVLAIDVIQLGSHTITPCAAPADTIANFSPASTTLSEAAGTYSLTVNLNQVADIQKTVDVSLATGNAADVDNFVTQTVTFAPSFCKQYMLLKATLECNISPIIAIFLSFK
jgi:predicted extracellular nuclease